MAWGAAEGERGHQDPTYRQAFVGREQELRQLQAAFDAALSGRGALVAVVGEPGIGKTALCEQLATYVTVRGGRTLVGHCYEEGSLSLPYLAFVEALRTYVLLRDPEGLKADLGSNAGDVARIVSEIRERAQVEPRGAAGDPEEDRWRLLQAITNFLRSASSVQALLMVLEDLHWADRGTLDLLLHLARNLVGSRLLVVATYRDVEVERGHPLSNTLAELRRSTTFERIGLRGLTIDEVHRMMNVIRGQEVPWGRAEAIHRQTEGNPLFVQEVLRYIVESGQIVREDGRYVPTYGSDPEAGIPEGLRDVIGKRLSHLSEKTNQVLAIAAVIGRDFRLDVLQRVAGLSEDEIDAALQEAAERAVVEERPALGVLAFRFTHAFFRQTLYEEIFASRRLRLHQQVARGLEAIHARRLEEHAGELAEHFAQSTDAADLEKALHYSELATQRSDQVFAYSEAVRHLERALQVQDVLDPDDKGKRCDLLLLLGQALMPLGDPKKVSEEIAPEAFALAEAVKNQTQAARAAVMAIEALHRQSTQNVGRPDFREWAERAMRGASLGTADQVHAYIALGRALFAGPEPALGFAPLRDGLDLARRLDEPDLLFTAVWNNIRCLWTPTRWREAVSIAEEFSTWPRQGVGSRAAGQFLEFYGAAMLGAGNRAAAERAWVDLAEVATKGHDAWNIGNARGFEGLLKLLDGDPEETIELEREHLAWIEQSGSTTQGLAGRAASRARIYLGDFDSGNSRDFLRLAYAGRREEALTALKQRAAQLMGGGRGAEQPAGPLVNLLEAAVAAEDRETTAELAGLLATGPPVSCAPGNITCLQRVLGAAHVLLGDPEQAKAYLTEALEVCEKVRFRPEVALTRFQLAELLVESFPDQRVEAREHLDFAIEEFRAMKMQPSLERALRLKESLGA